MRGAGLEPARYFYHEPLKLACLPFHHPRTIKTNLKSNGPLIAAIGARSKPRSAPVSNCSKFRHSNHVVGCGIAAFGVGGATCIGGATGAIFFCITLPPKTLPVARRAEAQAKKIDVAKKTIAIVHVSLVSMLPAPLEPNTVWLDPPKTAPTSAPLPC